MNLKLTRTWKFLYHVDSAVSRALDRLLPESLTTRYLIALGVIASLSIAGQIIIQRSLSRQLETQRYIRILDRQILLVEDIRKVALNVPLSANSVEAQRRIETISSLTERLREAHKPLGIDTVDGSPDSNLSSMMPILETALQGIAEANSQLETLFPRRSASASPYLEQILESSENYHLTVKQMFQHFEGKFMEQVEDFKKSEAILFVATILALIIEALYVFRPAVQRLYEALRIRSEFLSRMSHELRNPMNSIIGMANLLAETPITDQQENYLSVLRRSGASLLGMLNSLLDFSSIETGHLKLERITFYLYEVLERCLDLYVVVSEGNGTEVVLDIAPNVPLKIIGDPVRLQQVLSNLLGNAVKFTKGGTVALKVELIKEGDRSLILFAVEDTGIGIDKEKLNRIFDPFIQADSSIRRRYGGSGLGLSIARELVQQMGGDLRVVSEKGKGSIFSFAIPATFEESSDILAFLQKERIPRFEATVVTTNDLTYVMLKRLLEAAGTEVHRADAAHPPREELSTTNRLHALFVDLEYAKDHLKEIRSLHGTNPNLRFLFLTRSTTTASEIDQLGIRDLGIFIFKPIRAFQLYGILGSNFRKPVHDQALSPVRIRDERKLRILVADDSKDNHVLLQGYLQSYPYHFTFVENGAQAVEKFKSNSFDLVIMDIEMPELDGYAATEAIRSWEETKRIPIPRRVPILGISAYNNTTKARLHGFTGYLVKPISPGELLEEILRLTRSLPEKNVLSTGSHANSHTVASLEKTLQALGPTYLQNRRKEVAEMRVLIEKSEFKIIERFGHRMKGNALSYGHAELGQLGSALEEAAGAGDTVRVRALVSQIDNYVSNAITRLPTAPA